MREIILLYAIVLDGYPCVNISISIGIVDPNSSLIMLLVHVAIINCSG